MNNISKKVGYLRGLMEGMEFDINSANGKLIKGIVELLGDLSDRVEIIDELLDDLNDYVESIDDDLSLLEGSDSEDGFHFSDDEDDDDMDFDDDFDEAEDHLHLLHSEPKVEESEETLAGALCPKCNRMFFVSLNDPEGAKYPCPHCGEAIYPIPLTPDNAPTAHPLED